MRSLIRLTLATTAVAAIACGKGKANNAAMADDLKRDLQLATAQAPNMNVSPDELGPRSHQEMGVKLKKASGPRAIRSATPTVKASQTPREVAEIKAEIPQVQVVASAPSESENMAPSAPPSARPAPVPMPTYPGSGPSAGEVNGGSSGGGIGAVLGTIFGGGGGGGGVIIRGGGGIGDDHCDPRTDGRRGQRPGTYIPSSGGINPGSMGGVPRGGIMGRPRR